MCGSLTFWGYLWGVLSILVAASTSVGYYFADWLSGDPKFNGISPSNYTDLSFVNETIDLKFTFSTFRRCNHWVDVCANGARYCIKEECGRYSDFSGTNGIPSGAWQAGAILGGIACGLLILVALTATFAFFIKAIFNKYVAGICGFLQALAGLCMAATVVVYPIGWDSDTVKKEACGFEAGKYKLGDCSLGWAFWLSAASTLLALVAACLSPAAKKDSESLYSRGYTI